MLSCCFLLAACGLVLFFKHKEYLDAGPAKWLNAVYVWQEDWSSPVCQSVTMAARSVDGFMVFGAEIRPDDGKMRAVGKKVEWSALTSNSLPLTLVIRVSAERTLSKGGQSDELAKLLIQQAGRLIQAARRAGVKVAGVQIDLDCPTAHLAVYREIIRRVKSGLSGETLSITALPDWMRSREFKPLVREVSYFVMQVHALSPPKNIHDPYVLCDTSKLRDWVRGASSTGVPYYVALPTYGYRLFYDTAGKYVGFEADSRKFPVRPDMQMREVMADPDQMAAATQQLREHSPRNCLGVAWFRLPVETDRLNWPWPTFKAVIASRKPTDAYEATVRNPKPDLYEIWIKNSGERTAESPLHISLDLHGAALLARDGIGGYQWDREAVLAGPAPQPGTKRMAGWFRLIPDGNKSSSAQFIKVEVVK